MKTIQQEVSVKVADETWIAAALLHREYPERTHFTVSEIVERAKKENLHGSLRPGVRVHAVLHCVANLPPNPGGYRMLYATGKSTRRLFRPGDSCDPAREGKIIPERSEIPEQYWYLLDWYHEVYAGAENGKIEKPSILALQGLGRELWVDEDPDSYVKRLREGWR